MARRSASDSGVDPWARVAELLGVRVSPFRERVRRMDAVWIEPRVRVELTFSELVEGRLRDPVLRGLVAR